MSSIKSSFLRSFLLYFSITLVILGIVQWTLGTLRLYNASEQAYEKITPQKIYTTEESISAPPTTSIAPQKLVNNEASEDISFYVSENQESTQNTNKESLQEEIQKIEEKIPTITPTNQKNSTPQRSTETATKTPIVPNVIKNTSPKTPIVPNAIKSTAVKKPTSPIVISVTPKKSSAPKGYTDTILTVATGKYFRDALWKFPIIVDTERVEPRWQMYNESITLSGNIANLPEVSKVLVHEIGHMIDIYVLKASLRKTDPSEDFYGISWEDTSTIRAWVAQSSFISGYASTNQYEDFAESFAMYIFHNNEFLRRAKQDDILQQKYNFLQSRIFWDAFIGSSYEKNPIPKKVWDVTKIALRWNNLTTVFAWLQFQTPYYKS